MHDEGIVGEFTLPAESFNASAAANARETLDAPVELAAPRPGELRGPIDDGRTRRRARGASGSTATRSC